MTDNPRVVFCTTNKNRAAHTKLTLPRNLKDNEDYENCCFVLLDCGSDDDLIPYLKAHHANDILNGRLVVYSRLNDGPFRMGEFKNTAHRLGIREGAEILCNLDADQYTGRGFARYIANEFERLGDRGFLCARMVKGFMPRGVSGRIVITAKAFLKAGGYDEKYREWGPDDKDLHFRLRRLGYECFDIPVQFLDGIHHNDRLRFREYPHARPCEGDDDYERFRVEDLTTTVANFGRFGCASLWRNFDETDRVQLGPIPTRIFGIGLHKTATSSLHVALQILGLDAAHWITPRWARSIWEEMRAAGRSPTLERHYALTDLPLPLLYRELDRAYPGSRFILTMRNEADWLRSVEQHWSPANPWRASWDEDCFTHRCHTELYGRKSFDAQTFRARYWRHNYEVLAYFKNRPNDLLVLDIDEDTKWDGLCGFLDKPNPSVPYPKANRLREIA